MSAGSGGDRRELRRADGGSRARRRRRATIARRRARLGLLLAAIGLLVAVAVNALEGGGLPPPPRAVAVSGAAGGDPFAYAGSRETGFIARAIAGNAHVLYVKSPGGAIATARRVAAYQTQIGRAVAGTGIDPNLVAGLVFVESAGRPNAIAGSDPAGAAGLTQILAQTGQSLLGMPIDLAQSRRLTRLIDAVAAGTRTGLLAPLLARRAAADARFDPRAELAATVRYLQLAERQFGREDLAIESYHMGIGNLQHVLGDYNGGHSVPYAQLYFDTAPDHHASAYRLLAGFGDDSSLYYWRVLGAVQIMRLYRTDPTALNRLAALQEADGSGATALNPPDRTPAFADPQALAGAYQRRALVPLPANGPALGLAFNPRMGSEASKLGAPVALYRGLAPVALRLLIELAARVRALSGTAPLRVFSTVSDARYQQQQGIADPPSQTGYSFSITRRYTTGAQAVAFQAILDRLQSLDLIAWSRYPSKIEVTVAAGAR